MSRDLSRAILYPTLLFPTVSAAAAGCASAFEDRARFLDIDGAARIDAASSSEEGSQCADVPSTIFLADCAVSGCHSAEAMACGLDLEVPPYATGVGKNNGKRDMSTKASAFNKLGWRWRHDSRTRDRSLCGTAIPAARPTGNTLGDASLELTRGRQRQRV